MTTLGDVVHAVDSVMRESGFYSARPILARKLLRDLAIFEVRNVLTLTTDEAVQRTDLADVMDHMLHIANGELYDHAMVTLSSDRVREFYWPVSDLHRAALEQSLRRATNS